MKTTSYITPDYSHIKYTVNIPCCIDPEYWTSHKLTDDDIRQILSHVPSWLIWIVAVVYNKIITWAMIKYSFSYFRIFG